MKPIRRSYFVEFAWGEREHADRRVDIKQRCDPSVICRNPNDELLKVRLSDDEREQLEIASASPTNARDHGREMDAIRWRREQSSKYAARRDELVVGFAG